VTLSLGYHVGDALELARQLPDDSLDMIVTSPPYWFVRNYQVEGQWGLEPTIEAFVANLVGLFGELRRALKPTGTCWLNLGDSYARRGTAPMRPDHSVNELTGTRGQQGYSKASAVDAPKPLSGLKPKDLIGAPWRVALALQAAGWWLRSDIVWVKPNILPSSVRDRPAPAHEYLFLLTKAPRYYYDDIAVREPVTGSAHSRSSTKIVRARDAHRPCPKEAPHDGVKGPRARNNESWSRAVGNVGSTTRNCRDVWTIPTQQVRHEHFATFPEELARRCLLAGSSSHGVCSACGAPWVRIVERASTGDLRKNGTDLDLIEGNKLALGHTWPEPITLGWAPGCACEAPVEPALVLDPFMGSGTVARVCEALGRCWIGFDLDPKNAEIARKRLSGVQREMTEVL
jgi:DNA modification methylase